MKRKSALIIGPAFLALALPAAAIVPSLVVGNPPTGTSNVGIGPSGGQATTFIDATRPANASGNLNHAVFGFGGGPCPDAVKIKIFHRSGSTMTMTAQTPAISVTAVDAHSNADVTLSPPLPVQQGDLIGMVLLTTCGHVEAFRGFPSAGYYSYAGDISTFVVPESNNSDVLALGATGTTTEYTAMVVPAVGSLEGAFGSHIRTSFQIVAPRFGGSVAGRLVFHPAGQAGSSSDPSMAIGLGAGRSAFFADVVAAMGQSGLGSLDLVLSADSNIPAVFARVFNEGGSAGTTGLGEPVIDVTQTVFGPNGLVMFGGCFGLLSAPIDPGRFRMNIGLRSYSSDVTIQFTLKTETGTVRANASRSLEPNEFIQPSASDVFGITPGANDYIEVNVSGGAATVYGVTVDNTTNDPSAQFVFPGICVA